MIRYLVQIIYDFSFVKNYFCDSFIIESETLFLYSSNNSLEFFLSDILPFRVYSHSKSTDLIFEFIH